MHQEVYFVIKLFGKIYAIMIANKTKRLLIKYNYVIGRIKKLKVDGL